MAICREIKIKGNRLELINCSMCNRISLIQLHIMELPSCIQYRKLFPIVERFNVFFEARKSVHDINSINKLPCLFCRRLWPKIIVWLHTMGGPWNIANDKCTVNLCLCTYVKFHSGALDHRPDIARKVSPLIWCFPRVHSFNHKIVLHSPFGLLDNISDY